MKEDSALLDHASPSPISDALPIDRERPSGFVLQKADISDALELLDSFLQQDEMEQQETFGYLKKALDETRAAQGERPLFSNE